MHRFCWQCRREAHQPLPCALLSSWQMALAELEDEQQQQQQRQPPPPPIASSGSSSSQRLHQQQHHHQTFAQAAAQAPSQAGVVTGVVPPAPSAPVTTLNVPRLHVLGRDDSGLVASPSGGSETSLDADGEGGGEGGAGTGSSKGAADAGGAASAAAERLAREEAAASAELRHCRECYDRLSTELSEEASWRAGLAQVRAVLALVYGTPTPVSSSREEPPGLATTERRVERVAAALPPALVALVEGKRILRTSHIARHLASRVLATARFLASFRTGSNGAGGGDGVGVGVGGGAVQRTLSGFGSSGASGEYGAVAAAVGGAVQRTLSGFGSAHEPADGAPTPSLRGGELPPKTAPPSARGAPPSSARGEPPKTAPPPSPRVERTDSGFEAPMTALLAELRTSDVLHEQLEFLLERLAELLVAPLPDAPASGASGGAARRMDDTRIGASGGVHGGGAEAVVPFSSGEATIMTTSTAAAVAAAAAAGVSDGGRWRQMAADDDRWREMAVPGVADGGVDALSSRPRDLTKPTKPLDLTKPTKPLNLTKSTNPLDLTKPTNPLEPHDDERSLILLQHAALLRRGHEELMLLTAAATAKRRQLRMAIKRLVSAKARARDRYGSAAGAAGAMAAADAGSWMDWLLRKR
jgi:hypothetical protein